MKYEAVIFDLDGVICFTDHYHYLAWKTLADSIGVPFDEGKNDRLRGVSRMASLEIVLEECRGPILTGADKERIGLGGFFDAVSDGNNITRSKPDLQVFVMAAEMLRLPPDKCLVVEDAEAGIDAACGGGFDSAGLGPASRYGKTTYSMKSFAGLGKICAE